VLAGPDSFTSRFRYQQKYAPTITDVTALAGKNGTVVLRDYATGDFMPIRLCRTSNVRLVGDIVFLTAIMGEIPAIGQGSRRDEQLHAFNDAVSAQLGNFENTKHGDLTNLILFEDGRVHRTVADWKIASTDDQLASWGNCTIAMAEKFGLSAVDYYRIVYLQDAQGKDIQYKPDVKGGGYRIRGTATYSLEVLQRVFTGKTGDSSIEDDRFMELTTNSDDLIVVRGRQAVLGKYDVLHFYIRQVGVTTQSFAQIFLSLTGGTRTALSRVSPLELSVVIRPPLPIRIRSIVAACVFLTLFVVYLLFADPIAARFPKDWHVTAAGVDKFCTIGMIVVATWAGDLARDLSKRLKFGT